MDGAKWIKINTDIFDNDKIVFIRQEKNGEAIINIWFVMLCIAGKDCIDGRLMITETKPWTAEKIAARYRFAPDVVKEAIELFLDYDMITIENECISIKNWHLYQNLDAIEQKRDRDRKYRQERRERERIVNNTEKSREVITEIVEHWNSKMSGHERVEGVESVTEEIENALNELLLKYGKKTIISCIDKIEQSQFLLGKVKDFVISFTWFIKVSNFGKVLNGCYMVYDNGEKKSDANEGASYDIKKAETLARTTVPKVRKKHEGYNN